jgi:hypothetical protein
MTSKTTDKSSPEVRARAVRLVLDREGERTFTLVRDLVDSRQDEASYQARPTFPWRSN